MNRQIMSALLSVAVLAFAGCKSSTDEGGKAKPPLTSLPRTLSVQERTVIDASNRFAFDVLRETLRRDDKQNVFLSPLSATMALGMAMNGARGPTFEGMRRALGFESLAQTAINESYRDLIDMLLGLDSEVNMQIANSVWARQGFPFHDSFFATVKEFFDAEAQTLDFSASNASSTINKWVEEHTGGKIPKIVDDVLPDEDVMYLINAIYFKGDWRNAFDPNKTTNAPFQLANGSTKQVRMISGDEGVRVGGASGVQIVELPYGRDAYAMTIVLPAPGRDVRALVDSLDNRRWQEWTATLSNGGGMVRMPKFRLEYETEMNEALIALGMGLAFGVEPGTDFTGMSPRGEDLVITKVKQKTFIDVNEEGTEAAAATSVGIGVTSAPQPIVIDRPFLVAIRERLSGTILFLGVVGNP